MENFQIFPGYMHVIMYNIIVVRNDLKCTVRSLFQKAIIYYCADKRQLNLTLESPEL
jgi:hypothetical protein